MTIISDFTEEGNGHFKLTTDFTTQEYFTNIFIRGLNSTQIKVQHQLTYIEISKMLKTNDNVENRQSDKAY